MFTKSCEQCQKHGNIQNVHVSELHAITKPWPFKRLDIVFDRSNSPNSSKSHII